jgi:hypothetical protein
MHLELMCCLSDLLALFPGSSQRAIGEADCQAVFTSTEVEDPLSTHPKPPKPTRPHEVAPHALYGIDQVAVGLRNNRLLWLAEVGDGIRAGRAPTASVGGARQEPFLP